ASHDRRLVGTDVGELDRSRRRWWPRFFRAETRRARCTLKRVGPLQFGGLVVFVILSRGLEFATIPVAKTFSSPSGSSCMTSIRALWTNKIRQVLGNDGAEKERAIRPITCEETRE